MGNFCTNCGAKLGIDNNFCTNCGTKVDKSNIKSTPHNIEKEIAKKELKRVVGGTILPNKTFGNELRENGLDVINIGKAIRQQVEKEIDAGQIKSAGVEFRVNQLIHEYKLKKEEENKKLKMFDEVFESEIKSEIRKNKIEQIHVIPIKDRVKNKLIDKKEKMSEEEIKYFTKTEIEKTIQELEKARIAEEQEKARIAKEKEMNSKRIDENRMNNGGYCSFGCRHCYEEFLDSGGGIVGDFDSEGCVDYYCRLGHSVAFGRFCEDYE